MFALSCPLSLMSYNCRIQWLRVEGPPPPLSPHPGHSPGQGTRNLQCRDAFSPNPYYPSGGMVFDIALSIRECRFPVKPRPGENNLNTTSYLRFTIFLRQTNIYGIL